jgi:predicted GNAT family N-acyltransferase
MSKEEKPVEATPQHRKMINDFAEILGYDPSKSVRPTKDSLNKVLEKISKERQERAEKMAEELMTKAIAAVEQVSKAEKVFDQAKQAFSKEFSKTLRQINALVSGEDTPEEAESTEEAKT